MFLILLFLVLLLMFFFVSFTLFEVAVVAVRYCDLCGACCVLSSSYLAMVRLFHQAEIEGFGSPCKPCL